MTRHESRILDTHHGGCHDHRMYRAGSRRRLIVAGASAIIAAACGRRGADSAGPAHRWLPPARLELWLGGTAAPVEHVIRTTVLPALRAVHPTIRVTVAGTAPPGQSPPQNRGSSGWGLASPGQAAGMNPSVLGSAGGRLSGTSSLSLRGPTADGDAHNRLIADHAAGLTSDVIPAGTGNLSTVRHLRAARVVNHRDLVEVLRQDFVDDAVAHLTTDAGPLGVPWLANPRRYVWRTDTLAALGARIPQTWEDVVQACVRSSAGRPRSVGRRLLAVNGLHLDFYEALRHRGVWAIEYGKAAFAGDEGTAIARFFADRGQTDTIGRYGSGMTWGSDLSGQGVAGAWTTLAGLMRVITQATGAGPLVSVGAPIGAGGQTYAADASARGAIATHAWWYVSSATSAPDQAWELVRALVDPDAMVAVANASWQVPARRSAGRRGFLAHPLVQQFVGPYLDDGIAAPALPAQVEMEPILLNRLNAIARGEIDPVPALRDAARLWDEAITKAGHPETRRA